MMCCLGIAICEVYVAAILHFLIYISHESELLRAQLKFSFTNSVSFISILSLLILYQ